LAALPVVVDGTPGRELGLNLIGVFNPLGIENFPRLADTDAYCVAYSAASGCFGALFRGGLLIDLTDEVAGLGRDAILMV